jgi:hypothetical protein
MEARWNEVAKLTHWAACQIEERKNKIQGKVKTVN